MGLGMMCLALGLTAAQALAQSTSAPAETPPPTDMPAAPASDPGEVFATLTGADLVGVLKEIGWAAEAQEVDGKPIIYASFTDAETGVSYDFSVGLYRCAEDTKACNDVMFMRSTEATKPVTLKMVNTYNAKQIFGVAYLNDDGTLGLSMSVTVQGGVTRQNLKETADWWKTIITGFDAKVTGG
jgi:hypothetical protein